MSRTSGGRGPIVLFAVLILTAGVLGGSLTGYLVQRRSLQATPGTTPSAAVAPTDTTPPPSLSPTPGPTSTSATATPSGSSSAPTPTGSPTPTLSAAEREQQARTQLVTLAQKGLATAKPRGQWVAQLAGKYIGITDPQQKTATGSHTFNAVDIVAEYAATKPKAEALGVTVVLIKGSDIAKGRDEPTQKVFWFTFGLDFASQAEAQGFCERLYPTLTGDALKNVCFPTQLKP